MPHRQDRPSFYGRLAGRVSTDSPGTREVVSHARNEVMSSCSKAWRSAASGRIDVTQLIELGEKNAARTAEAAPEVWSAL